MADTQAARYAERTAQMTADHPGCMVVRTVVPWQPAQEMAMLAGFSTAASTRYGHLVADANGIRMYQGRNDIEWEKSWLDLVSVGMSDDGRAIRLDAVGWYEPKFYAPCQPSGDALKPFAVEAVLRRLQELEHPGVR